MAQIFRSRSNTIARSTIIGAAVAFVGLWTLGDVMKWSSYITRVGEPPLQPIPFSHKHHVNDDGIDCRYCHSSVEISAFAGLPATSVCMNCHSQLWSDSPTLKPVRDSFASKTPIRWEKVNVLPDYVFFNHSIHVRKGVGCTSCHGQINEMPLTAKSRTFYMRDCLSCHRNPEPELRPASEIYSLIWKRSDSPPEQGHRLLQEYRIDKHRLTNCYTCHR